VVDRHRGHDLLRIEEDRERALDRHAGLDRLPGLVDAADTLGQPRIERIGLDEIVVLWRGHVRDNVGNCPGSRKRAAAIPANGPITCWGRRPGGHVPDHPGRNAAWPVAASVSLSTAAP